MRECCYYTGTELMLLILKQKRIARTGALKALNFATTKSAPNCERFVDQLGLKTIFALFMGKIKVSISNLHDWENDRCVNRSSLIWFLMQAHAIRQLCLQFRLLWRDFFHDYIFHILRKSHIDSECDLDLALDITTNICKQPDASSPWYNYT